MPRVLTTTRVTHSRFVKLPLGSDYWATSGGTASAPLIKYNRSGHVGGWTQSTGKLTVTSDTLTADVTRVPRIFSKKNRLV